HHVHGVALRLAHRPLLCPGLGGEADHEDVVAAGDHGGEYVGGRLEHEGRRAVASAQLVLGGLGGAEVGDGGGEDGDVGMDLLDRLQHLLGGLHPVDVGSGRGGKRGGGHQLHMGAPLGGGGG